MSENIIRVAKDGDYAVINNTPLNDDRLSWEARGVLAYLLTKPNDWVIRNHDLEKKGKIGGCKLSRILSELKTAGYLTRTRYKKSDGTFQWETIIYEKPTIPRLSIHGSSIDGQPGYIVSTELLNTESISKGKERPYIEEIYPTKPETTTEIEHGEEKISPDTLPPSITYPVREESVTLTGKKDNLIKDPRVGAYRGLAHLTPNQVQREEICNRVTDLELWQATITGWLGHGWNPKNITGMLEVYEKGGLDKSGRNNDHKTTINPGTDREVNSNYPTGVTKSDGVPGWNDYDR